MSGYLQNAVHLFETKSLTSQELANWAGWLEHRDPPDSSSQRWDCKHAPPH